jgi:DNA-binding CsgD family transcriptional regulator/PAS domain-containing protein
LDAAWQGRYREYYAGLNMWTERAGHLWLPGQVGGGDELIGGAALVKTEFYADFLRPQEQFHAIGGMIAREDSVSYFVTAFRNKRNGSFGEEEHALARQLMPHLDMALRIQRRIAGLETRLEQTSDALNQASQGIIFANAAGMVLFMNRQAETILGQNSASGLSLQRDGLHARLPRETARLRDLILRTGDTIAGNGTCPGGAMSISRPGGLGPLKVLVAPLPSSGCPGRCPAVVLFVSAPERAGCPGAALLEQLLDLTPAEGRLASALIGGKTVREFAEEAGVSLNTARTHLKNVFSKTGVSRQPELIRMALTLTGTWFQHPSRSFGHE